MHCSQIQSGTKRKPQQQASGTCKWPLVLFVQNEINPANQALRNHSSAEGEGFPANRRYNIAYMPLKKKRERKKKIINLTSE